MSTTPIAPATPPADYPVTDRTVLPVRVLHRSPSTGRVTRRGLATERDAAGRLMVWWTGASAPTFHSLGEEPLALELSHASTWPEVARALAERVLVRDDAGTPSWAPEAAPNGKEGEPPLMLSCYAAPASLLLQRCGAAWILMAFGVTAAQDGRSGQSFAHVAVFAPPADHLVRGMIAGMVPGGADMWEVPGLTADLADALALSTIWSMVRP